MTGSPRSWGYYYILLRWVAYWLQWLALLQAVASDTCTYEGTSDCFPFGFWPWFAYIAPCFPLALSARLGPPKVPWVEGDHYIKSWTRSCGTSILVAVLHNIPSHRYLSPSLSYQENGEGASCTSALQNVNLTEVYLDVMLTWLFIVGLHGQLYGVVVSTMCKLFN